MCILLNEKEQVSLHNILLISHLIQSLPARGLKDCNFAFFEPTLLFKSLGSVFESSLLLFSPRLHSFDTVKSLILWKKYYSSE